MRSTKPEEKYSTASMNLRDLLFGGNRGFGDIYSIAVLCKATQPTWAQADHFVFTQTSGHKGGRKADYGSETSEMSPTNTELEMSPASTVRSTMTRSTTRRRAKADDKLPRSVRRADKNGQFYSASRKEIGAWRIQGNVLKLVWESGQIETAIATQSARWWTNSVTNLEIHVLEPHKLPEWMTPDKVAKEFETGSKVDYRFECGVCFLELWRLPVGVLRMHSRRCCSHYLHMNCAKHLFKITQRANPACPICGVEFNDIKQLPDLTSNPREWFATVDADFSGELSQTEVVDALGVSMPFKRDKLTKSVASHWQIWDPDMDGGVSLEEFIKPNYGLRDWVLKHYKSVGYHEKPLVDARDLPDVDSDPRGWFEYWDVDNNGTMDREEIIRALIRTFCVTAVSGPQMEYAHEVRSMVHTIWRDLSYSPFDEVTFEEFIKPYGVADQFLHNQLHLQWFGDDVERVADLQSEDLS